MAGAWHEYSDHAGDVEIFAFLREADPALAGKYLEATKRYLKLYEGMLPAYPYASFALVENFWETGYGMPSFTLLGPRIIRFPFILHSSYPHEILHNWWGNSVFVEFESGNWCEGLTAYLADHLVKEGLGRGAEYRRDTLKNYSNFIHEGKDFPLAEFRSRHSSASEAVGYGKSLMLWHMLRRSIGDKRFTAGLRGFYAAYRFADIDAMESLWSTRRSVATIESSGNEVFGREAVMAFWHRQLTHGTPPDIRPRDPTVIGLDNVALVFCVEDRDDSQTLATNVFVKRGRNWQIVHHQSGPLSSVIQGDADDQLTT